MGAVFGARNSHVNANNRRRMSVHIDSLASRRPSGRFRVESAWAPDKYAKAFLSIPRAPLSPPPISPRNPFLYSRYGRRGARIAIGPIMHHDCTCSQDLPPCMIDLVSVPRSDSGLLHYAPRRASVISRYSDSMLLSPLVRLSLAGRSIMWGRK